MEEIYVSTDVECNGPIPGLFSMISLGSVAFDGEGEVLDTFSVNLRPLPDAQTDPSTMKWWKSQPEAWAATQEKRRDPQEAMMEYVDWLQGLPGKPVFVGYPITFDFMFVYWYLIRFVGYSPFGISGIDIKTYAMAYLKTPFRDTVKKNMPKEWRKNRGRHSHKAVEDAQEQGQLFFNIRESIRRLVRN